MLGRSVRMWIGASSVHRVSVLVLLLRLLARAFLGCWGIASLARFGRGRPPSRWIRRGVGANGEALRLSALATDRACGASVAWAARRGSPGGAFVARVRGIPLCSQCAARTRASFGVVVTVRPRCCSMFAARSRSRFFTSSLSCDLPFPAVPTAQVRPIRTSRVHQVGAVRGHRSLGSGGTCLATDARSWQSLTPRGLRRRIAAFGFGWPWVPSRSSAPVLCGAGVGGVRSETDVQWRQLRPVCRPAWASLVCVLPRCVLPSPLPVQPPLRCEREDRAEAHERAAPRLRRRRPLRARALAPRRGGAPGGGRPEPRAAGSRGPPPRTAGVDGRSVGARIGPRARGSDIDLRACSPARGKEARAGHERRG